VYTTTSQSYVDVFKKQFSLNLNPQTLTTENSQPPHKQQATIIDYDSDQSVTSPLSNSTITQSNSSSCSSTPATIPTVMAPSAYAMELIALKQEISQLKTTIMMAVEQITKAVDSLQVTPRQPMSNVMDIDSEHMPTTTSNTTTNLPSQPLDLPAIISDLKNEIATISNETHALLLQYLPPKPTTKTPHPSAN